MAQQLIFLSYSSCDRAVAENLLNYLEGRGIKCWIAFRDITSGNFSGEITRALRNSDIMVVVCSKESCRSEHVKNEVTLAFNQKKHIVPYLLEDNPFDDDLEYFLSLKQHIKTRGTQDKDFALIEKFIRDYRGESYLAPAPSAAPASAPVAPPPAPAPVAPAPTPAAPAPVSEPKKKSSAGIIAAVVAAVVVLGGGGAYFALNKPAAEPQAQPVAQQPVAQQPVAQTQPAAQQPVAQTQPQAQSQPQTQVTEQPKTTSTATATTPAKTETKPAAKATSNPNMDSFTGNVVNGYPDGFGTYTFKTRRRIDMHDAEERYAEAGDYIKGDWKEGHLNYGEWHSADGTKKAFIRLGDHPDNIADQKLGKCAKK